ncbi:hypothetical protein ACVK1X_006245 [Pseudomonas sp. PvR086]|jgi:hypothetical protein|nr:hypothetical protein [Pseudomonas frederiksbergensis]PZW55618.1 hypothetical protein F475_04792 [Pseudomonas sp. URMO17WK12:I6]CAH0245504.1 hypothetical protein SRABI130_03103 [Pseudomonas sp. Bi130]
MPLTLRGGAERSNSAIARSGSVPGIDSKASGVIYGENGEKWMILGGY